jgi:hypothetical protein
LLLVKASAARASDPAKKCGVPHSLFIETSHRQSVSGDSNCGTGVKEYSGLLDRRAGVPEVVSRQQLKIDIPRVSTYNVPAIACLRKSFDLRSSLVKCLE